MVAIGGIGGSGTRVVAELFKQANYFLGDDLNKANDNLLFTLLFKRESILITSDREFSRLWGIFSKIMERREALSESEIRVLKTLSEKDRTLHDKAFLRQRLNFIDYDIKVKAPWGWKEPNTHIVIEKIFKQTVDLKFIYVYRHPLDMAYSSNQNQLKLWGDIFFDQKNVCISPENSLKYWCMVHRKMKDLKNSYSNRVFFLNFDNLSINGEVCIKGLETFMDSDIDLAAHLDIVKTPKSIGRHMKYSLECFDENDLAYIRSIEGLDLECCMSG